MGIRCVRALHCVQFANFTNSRAQAESEQDHKAANELGSMNDEVGNGVTKSKKKHKKKNSKKDGAEKEKDLSSNKLDSTVVNHDNDDRGDASDKVI